MSALLDFTLAAMTSLAPMGDHVDVGGAIARVATSEPPLFRGDDDRRHTAALIIAVAFREGSLRRRIHGDCRDAQGRTMATPSSGVCERPGSFCTMQIHVTSGGSERLNDDPEACIRVGIAMLRQSMHVCPAWPVAFYASGPGACTNERAQRISSDRMWIAGRLFKEVAP